MKRVLMGLAAVAVLTFAPQQASAQTAADLTLVHGLATTVVVAVDGTIVIPNFEAGSLANISSFAGQTLANVTVTDDASGEVLIGPVAQLVVPESGSYSIVAHLDADGTAVLSTFENNTAVAADGQARVTLRHAAAAEAVDLIVGTQRPIVGATNGQSAELELPVGDLSDAQIAPTGEDASAQIATLTLAANTNTIVYVVGSTDDDTIDFVVQVVNLAVPATTTTTVAGATTTTVAGATTTTVAGATTTTTTTIAGATTTTVVPTAVNTGSPIGGSSSLVLIVLALGGLTLAGGAMVARRRI